MNVSDSEIVETILENSGYLKATSIDKADVVLINTCAIREGAEKKIWNKLQSNYFAVKKRGGTVGILGCMAERIKEKFLEHKVVDLVAGPDAYRDLPRLLKVLDKQDESDPQQAINV
jgi:tRNA-2-methylthio-N6-dimethylallyladenosine synthase